MSDEDHAKQHFGTMRFSARHTIAGIGGQCGEKCAAASAKGLIRGSVDELVTMIGEKETFEYLASISDSLTAKAAAAWGPGKQN